jgi:hypothetical protein
VLQDAWAGNRGILERPWCRHSSLLLSPEGSVAYDEADKVAERTSERAVPQGLCASHVSKIGVRCILVTGSKEAPVGGVSVKFLSGKLSQPSTLGCNSIQEQRKSI